MHRRLLPKANRVGRKEGINICTTANSCSGDYFCFVTWNSTFAKIRYRRLTSNISLASTLIHSCTFLKTKCLLKTTYLTTSESWSCLEITSSMYHCKALTWQIAHQISECWLIWQVCEREYWSQRAKDNRQDRPSCEDAAGIQRKARAIPPDIK